MAQSAALTNAIINTSTTMFLELGYDGTSMEAIASALTIPKTTLYNRYADKRQLAQAVVAHEVQTWSMITSRDDDALPENLATRLRHFTAVMLRWTAKPRVRAIMRLAINLHPRSAEELPPVYSEMHAYLVGQIETYGPLAGICPKRADYVVDALMALVQNRTRASLSGSLYADQTPEERAADIVALLMDGAKAW